MTRRRQMGAPVGGTRRAAREFAFRVLFEAERGEADLQETMGLALARMHGGDEAYPRLSEDAIAFARELVDRYSAGRPEVEALLRRTIRGWDFGQLAQTDLNVMRLAAVEMLNTDTPHPPVIESAVRIARKFGGEESGRFVNGVLAGLSRDLEARGAADRADLG